MAQSAPEQTGATPDVDSMARYFFNHRGADGNMKDQEGAQFASLAEATAEASLSVREMIAGKLLTGGDLDWSSVIEIADTEGRVLFTLSYRQAAGVPDDGA